MLILFTILQLCDKDQIDNPVKVYHTYVPEQTEFQQLDLDELDEFIKEKELNLDTSLNTDLYLMKPVDNTVTSPIYSTSTSIEIQPPESSIIQIHVQEDNEQLPEQVQVDIIPVNTIEHTQLLASSVQRHDLSAVKPNTIQPQPELPPPTKSKKSTIKVKDITLLTTDNQTANIMKPNKSGGVVKRTSKAGKSIKPKTGKALISMSDTSSISEKSVSTTAEYNMELKLALKKQSFNTVEHACSIIQSHSSSRKALKIDFHQHLAVYRKFKEAKTKEETKLVNSYHKSLKLTDYKYTKCFIEKINKAVLGELGLIEDIRTKCSIKYGRMINAICIGVARLYTGKSLRLSDQFLFNVGCLLQDYCYSLFKGTRHTTKMMKLKHINEKMFESFHSTMKKLEPTNRLVTILNDMAMTSSKLEEMDEIASKKCIFPSVDALKSSIFYACFEDLVTKPTSLEEVADRLNNGDEEMVELFQSKLTDGAAKLIIRQMLRFLGCLAYNITLIDEYSANASYKMPSSSKKDDVPMFTAPPLEWDKFKEHFDFTLYEFTDTLTNINSYNLEAPTKKTLKKNVQKPVQSVEMNPVQSNDVDMDCEPQVPDVPKPVKKIRAKKSTKTTVEPLEPKPKKQKLVEPKVKEPKVKESKVKKPKVKETKVKQVRKSKKPVKLVTEDEPVEPIKTIEPVEPVKTIREPKVKIARKTMKIKSKEIIEESDSSSDDEQTEHESINESEFTEVQSDEDGVETIKTEHTEQTMETDEDHDENESEDGNESESELSD